MDQHSMITITSIQALLASLVVWQVMSNSWADFDWPTEAEADADGQERGQIWKQVDKNECPSCPLSTIVARTCGKSVAEGGCCGADGVRLMDGHCSGCAMQGSPSHWSCSCGSPCSKVDTVRLTEHFCRAASCSGGCLVGGICDYSISETACFAQQDIYCQACPAQLWQVCAPYAYCYGMCDEGCCRDSRGGCPQYPYAMHLPVSRGAQCYACYSAKLIFPLCDQCFPRSVCSSAYDVKKYPVHFNTSYQPPARVQVGRQRLVVTETMGSTDTSGATSASSTAEVALGAEEKKARSGASRSCKAIATVVLVCLAACRA
eukprot:TRINITY_DN20522_c0_g1_i2.p1 TRINITY_DN20522_c0_g1~~TRINITY_DN20522_c0_g1_i2.p1  ORF type:complete len:318 (+),score=15.13 TRINITY_DN20522_c0_g1_i2:287-1240(+)